MYLWGSLKQHLNILTCIVNFGRRQKDNVTGYSYSTIIVTAIIMIIIVTVIIIIVFVGAFCCISYLNYCSRFFFLLF